ncbi:MAG: aminodeoxychorismate/anthranilate synthase component II [Blastopirellula sp.]|nr:MAG: aminodeoxychorismate/anthranilate synthase component II [Blastopirellula sp.]
MILLIDNYDSFVYNLARYFELLGQPTVVVRNDQIDLPQIQAMKPAAIVLSPGPCTPDEAGVSLEVVQQLATTYPILGICLGHQVIVQAMGGTITRAVQPMHGRTSLIDHQQHGLFAGIESPLEVCRYHSLIAHAETVPDCLSIEATAADGLIMAVSHKELPVYGVQFHPESILTQSGFQLLANFLAVADIPCTKNITELQSQIEDLDQPTSGVYPTKIPSYY